MIELLACRKLLDGMRGAPSRDVAALAHALAAFSVMCGERAGSIVEVGVTPVIVNEDGVIAVDAPIGARNGR